MKIEIEITEEEIKSAIERKVRVAIADKSQGWTADEDIKRKVKDMWSEAVDKAVKEELGKLTSIREKIRAEIERKLRAQISAAVREASK